GGGEGEGRGRLGRGWAPPRRGGQPGFERGPRAAPRLFHVELLDAHLAHVERVGDRGLQHLLHDARARLGREVEDVLSILHPPAPDQIEDLVRLARRDAHVSLDRSRFHDYFPGASVFSATCWPCPGKTRVGTNSPSLWPTMFSVT